MNLLKRNSQKNRKSSRLLLLPTFPVGLSFNDLTDAPRPHCILGRQSEFVPGAALQVLQAVGALTGADGKTAPLLTVVL